MKLTIVNSGTFKLDGGAMFGVVPKVMWNKFNPADDQNLCTWTMRSLLIETEHRKILIDTGIGMKQDEKFRSHFFPSGGSTISSLLSSGINPNDITDVFLTHLHFDHCGEAVSLNEKGQLVPTFLNATYWSNKKHWDWALEANPREKASFLLENFAPLQDYGVLKFIDTDSTSRVNWIEGIEVMESNGHTKAMMIPFIPYNGSKLVFMADLCPSIHHIPLAYIMAYDLWPFQSMAEKSHFLEEAVLNNYILYFQHDKDHVTAKVSKNDKGKFVVAYSSKDNIL